jgi:uncharacterized protein with HEPN domain
MAHDDRLTVGQMLDTVVRIRALVRGLSPKAFETDEIRQLALLHLIQTLGEAASRTSAAFRERHPELPWTQMIAMRNRIVHGYDHVDPDIVWRVATDDAEALLATLERLAAT